VSNISIFGNGKIINRRPKMRQIKNLIAKMLIGCLVLFCVNLNVNARFFANGSDEGYPGDGEKSYIPIENYVIDGAGYFLKGYSDIQKFLNLFELQDKNGIDYYEWQTVVNSAWSNVNNAVQTYNLLIKKAESTPYNEEFISRLIYFKYSEFIKENDLNSIIFNKCEDYLKKGDITGMYKHTLAEFTDIIDILSNVKEDLSFNKLPELSILWKLNETCAELSLFGQYASRVFFEIMGK
jgi:hypothetical protein